MPTPPKSPEPVPAGTPDAKNAATTPILVVFLSLTIVFFLCWKLLSRSPVDYVVLLVGNGLLFLLAMISHRMSMRAMNASGTHGFLRGVYGGFLLKFFVLAAVALIYIAHYQKDLNKPGFFGCFGLYLIYTFVETRGVIRANPPKNA